MVDVGEERFDFSTFNVLDQVFELAPSPHRRSNHGQMVKIDRLEVDLDDRVGGSTRDDESPARTEVLEQRLEPCSADDVRNDVDSLVINDRFDAARDRRLVSTDHVLSTYRADLVAVSCTRDGDDRGTTSPGQLNEASPNAARRTGDEDGVFRVDLRAVQHSFRGCVCRRERRQLGIGKVAGYCVGVPRRDGYVFGVATVTLAPDEVGIDQCVELAVCVGV